MPYFAHKFFGLTVGDIKTQLGWGGQASQLNLHLVQNIAAGDIVAVPRNNTPCYLQFGAMSFAGLLQRFERTHGTDGLPTFEATLVDPREVLDGAQVITAAYAGGTLGMPNLINAYGYWESRGFGQSNANSAGMPWSKVVSAITTLVNTPAGNSYGGPLTFAGYRYGIDLSELPSPPGYYRVPGPALSLLELITLVCEDSGCDFFVQLVGMTIKIRVASRFFQPPLGTISSLALSGTFSGQTVRSMAGVESRNEVTSAFLIGGEQTAVYMGRTFASYWGTDVRGAPIYGEPGTLGGFGACEFANLNAADCADIVGSVTYRCSTIEMRFALWSPEAWGTFLSTWRPDIANLVGASIYGTKGRVPVFAPDIVKDAAADVTRAISENLAERRSRLFDLVLRAAEDFYGKQYVVALPHVQAAQDPETGVIRTTYEPTSSGYMAFGGAELGVPSTRLEILQDADERVMPFVYYPQVAGANTARVDMASAAFAPTGEMWARVQVTGRLIPAGPGGQVGVHVRLSAPLYDKPVDQFGSANLLAVAFAPDMANPNGVTPEQLLAMDANRAIAGTLGYLGIHPPAIAPAAFGIPLKSNVAVYGPWVAIGAPGKVRFEQDPGLTPWDYGSMGAMNLAGNARVLTAITNQQVSESGGIVYAGPPGWSLGDILKTGGPNLTNLEIAYGPSGVTTSYRFQTFTPKFGLFSRQQSERMRRLSLRLVEQRRGIRKALARAIAAAATYERAARGAKINRMFYTRKQSPHTVLMAQGVADSGLVRSAAASETYETGTSLVAQGEGYQDKAIMSLTGLVRGFSTNPAGTSLLPRYTTATGGGLTNESLNPFAAGHDIEVVAWGNDYAGSHTYANAVNPADSRGLALRGPLVVAGYGPGIDGYNYPADGNGQYVASYRRRSDLWKVGAVDLLWDPYRSVWTCHDLRAGSLVGTIAPGATGTLAMTGGGHITVRNRWSVSLPSTARVICGYIANTHEWEIIAQDCA